MKRKISILLFAMLLVLTSCTTKAKPAESGELESSSKGKKIVYTSFYPLYDFTSKIVQDKMDVRLIIPAGAEPHDYEVSAKTLSEMNDADSILLLGLEFEPWSEGLDATLKEKVLFVGESARPIPYKGHDADDHDHEGEAHDHDHDHEGEAHDHGHHHHHGLYDPHVWMDPTRAIDMSKVILAEVSKIDPENKDFYTKNFEDFSAKLSELDKKLQEISKKHHDAHKDIIVSHNAFSYLTDTYDIHFESIAGLSPEAEPSLKTISEIIDEIKEHDIRYIFFEELSNSKIIESIAAETQAKVDILYTIEGMTEDEMKKGEDYLFKMNQNIEKIDLALQ
ncbi:MAG: zinc ABC transporter substrate-binding protein [Peptostreptococcaceae bacterium]|nr:zinc ABC transporter substrate-binding protein [Peptostreptococcaceae bacterium]